MRTRRWKHEAPVAQATHVNEGIRLLFILGGMALMVYAFVVVVRNRAWCRFLWPFGLAWSVLTTVPLLAQAPFVPADKGGVVFTTVLMRVAVTTVTATAGTFLWLQLGYRPFPRVWRLMARWWRLPAEEALVAGEHLGPRRRPEPFGLAAICAGSVILTLVLLAVMDARPAPRRDLVGPKAEPVASPESSTRRELAAEPVSPDGEPGSSAGAKSGDRLTWRDVPKGVIALVLMTSAMDGEITCRLLALAVVLGLCRRRALSGHVAVLTVAAWWALGQWGTELIPAWIEPFHALAFGVLAGYLMVFSGLEACMMLQLCLSLCSPLLWAA